MSKRKIIDTHAHLASKILGHPEEGAGHMFRYRPAEDVPVPEMDAFGNIDYYEIYTRGKFRGERLWPDELWAKAEKDSELMAKLTSANSKWMGNRCQKNTFHNVQKILDENGVDYICMMPMWPANSFEDYLVASKLDSRILPFTCICNTELNAADAAAKLLNDVKLGARGLKMHPIVQNMDLKTDYVKEILQVWAKTGLPVVSHCGSVEFGIADQGAPDYGNPKFLADLIDEFPEVKFVAAHCGGCRSWESAYFAERIGKRDNVWVDTSFRPHDEIEWMVETFGEDRVLMGSDIPYSDMDITIECIEETALSEKIKEKIFWGNAAELLGIE